MYGALKGHESIAQALAWVYILNETALKGRQKIVLRHYAYPRPFVIFAISV
jgi:hypothetical protein